MESNLQLGERANCYRCTYLYTLFRSFFVPFFSFCCGELFLFYFQVLLHWSFIALINGHNVFVLFSLSISFIWNWKDLVATIPRCHLYKRNTCATNGRQNETWLVSCIAYSPPEQTKTYSEWARGNRRVVLLILIKTFSINEAIKNWRERVISKKKNSEPYASINIFIIQNAVDTIASFPRMIFTIL